MKNPKDNIVIISDLHAGCQFGLCPPKVHLDNHGTYTHSDLQKKVWSYWLDFWEYVDDVFKGEPFTVICNGDAIDGVHHNSVTQITQNLTDQQKIAYQILKPIVDKCEGNYYHLRGTPAHVGSSGMYEEALAKSLGAIPSQQGNYARWELFLKCKEALCHVSHHANGRTPNALLNEMKGFFMESGLWGEEAPQFLIRSHIHKHLTTGAMGKNGYYTAFTTAGWQLRTPFVFKLSDGRTALPEIGGSIIRAGHAETHTRHKVYKIKRGRVEV